MSDFFLFPMGTDRTQQTISSKASITLSEDGKTLDISIPVVSIPSENATANRDYSQTHRMCKPSVNLRGDNISTVIYGSKSSSSVLQITVDLLSKVPLTGGIHLEKKSRKK